MVYVHLAKKLHAKEFPCLAQPFPTPLLPLCISVLTDSNLLIIIACVMHQSFETHHPTPNPTPRKKRVPPLGHNYLIRKLTCLPSHILHKHSQKAEKWFMVCQYTLTVLLNLKANFSLQKPNEACGNTTFMTSNSVDSYLISLANVRDKMASNTYSTQKRACFGIYLVTKSRTFGVIHVHVKLLEVQI